MTLSWVTSVDEQGAIRSFNPAAERIFDYPENEIIGQNIGLLFPPQGQGQGQHIDYLENYLKTGTKAFGVTTEVAGLRRNGATFPLDIAVVEMHGGERRMFVVILRDISERKLVGRKSQLKADLERAMRTEKLAYGSVRSKGAAAGHRGTGDWLSTDTGQIDD